MTHDNIDILVVDDDISHCTILQALLRGCSDISVCNMTIYDVDDGMFRLRSFQIMDYHFTVRSELGSKISSDLF